MCYKVLLQYYSKPTPTLLCTTKYYSSTTLTTKFYASTTLYYKVLRQYNKVLRQYYFGLQSTNPVLFCTTLYYTSTTLYYKVLQRPTPVLLCTTKYYSVLQSTTVVLLCTTKYYSSTTLKRHLQCAEQQASPSNLTKYCASHAKWISLVIRIAYATSFTMRGATGITLQPHQILHLPRKMNLMIDPHHIWNVIYNARSNRHHPPTSPNTAPATQNECHDWSCSHMKRHFQCAEQQESPSNFIKYCACHAKWTSWLIPLTYETSFTMRGATGINLQPHQILRLPRKIAFPNLREM